MNSTNEMSNWHNLHITDHTGQVFFPCTASPMATASEIKNLKAHLERAKMHQYIYHFLDIASAVIMLDGLPYGEASEIDADALLKELGL
jgi:hypothetical protein